MRQTAIIAALLCSTSAFAQTYNVTGTLTAQPDGTLSGTVVATPATAPPQPQPVAPDVVITTPTAGATVNGSVPVNATCTVPEGHPACTHVDFSIDGVYKATQQIAPYDYTFDTTTVPNGNHTISAYGRIGSDASTEKDVVVNVNNQSTPPPDGGALFEWTQTFDAEPVGSRVDYPAQRRLFPADWGWNSNYVQNSDNSTPCEWYSGASGQNCKPAPNVLFKIVADGKSGNALEVKMPKDSYGYPQNGAGTVCLTNGFTKKITKFTVEWDEKWRSGFDLHSMGKNGLAITFARGSTQIFYGPQNMWYNYQGSTTEFAPVVLDMGDGGGNGAVVEYQVYVSPRWQLNRWYHMKVENALGPNGYYKLWVDGALVNSYAPGAVAPSTGQTISGGTNSATDSRNTTNPSEFTTRQIGICPHFGGQYNDRAFVDSYMLIDNVHAKGN